MNIKGPEVFCHLQIHRLSKKEAYFLVCLVLKNFQIRLVFILTTALCYFFFYRTHHLLTYYINFLFIMLSYILPVECKHNGDRDFCMFFINGMYSQHLK